MTASAVELFDRVQVDPVTRCWHWTGNKPSGYGLVSLKSGRAVSAHRLIYEWMVGPISPDHEIDHLCRVRDCCNPSHLEAVTHSENIRRSQPRRGGHTPITLLPDYIEPADLLGPADIAEMLGVQPATTRQWLLRDLLPAPVYVNSSGRVKLWAYDDIDRWARATGRRVEVTEPEF